MRVYYMFNIKKEYCDVYRKNENVLYLTLESLYKLKGNNMNYGLSLYEQICDTFDTERIQNYFSHLTIEKKQNRCLIEYNNEQLVFDIHHSCLVCYSKINIPFVFKNLLYYDKNIFVCDFLNKDYFFINKQNIPQAKYAYNLI